MHESRFGASHLLAAAVGIAIGVGAFGLFSSPSKVTAAPAKGAQTPHETDPAEVATGCPPCPDCPRPMAAPVSPVVATAATEGKRRPSFNPRDHALRWPNDVPQRFRPEFVRRIVKEAQVACEGILPSQLQVDCKTFPCTIVSSSSRPSWLLADPCDGLAPLGPIRTTSRGKSGKEHIHVTRQVVPEELQLYDKRNAALRKQLLDGNDIVRLKCEMEDEPSACASWATKLASQDLDAAIGLATIACDEGAGSGCTLLAALGENPAANFLAGCQKGDGQGCVGAVQNICGRDGQTCTAEAVSHAQKWLDGLEKDPKSYEWTKRKARELVGKTMCASEQTDEGLALLTATCTDNHGELRKWCDPQKMCDAPRFYGPNVW